MANGLPNDCQSRQLTDYHSFLVGGLSSEIGFTDLIDFMKNKLPELPHVHLFVPRRKNGSVEFCVCGKWRFAPWFVKSNGGPIVAISFDSQSDKQTS